MVAAIKDPGMNRRGWCKLRWTWYWEALNHQLEREITSPPKCPLAGIKALCRVLELRLRDVPNGDEKIQAAREDARWRLR